LPPHFPHGSVNGGPPVLLVDPHTRCWTGPHAAIAGISLVALSYYVPLAVMISPILAQVRLEGERGFLTFHTPLLTHLLTHHLDLSMMASPSLEVMGRLLTTLCSP
jgi:hypothetical protein